MGALAVALSEPPTTPRAAGRPYPAARLLRAPGLGSGRTPPVPVHLSPAAPGSQPPPAASGCSSEPPPPFCTGGRSRGTNPHCPRARRRRRTPAPCCGPRRAGLGEPLWRPRSPEAGGGSGELGTADTVTEPEEEQQPPPPRSVYLRLTIPPPPGPSLDRPASAAFLIGHPKECPTPGLVRLGKSVMSPPPRVRSCLWLVTLDKARAPPPLSNWRQDSQLRLVLLPCFPLVLYRQPPFALLVLAQSYRKRATLPISHWCSRLKPPSYDDVTFLRAQRALSGW